MPPIPAAVVCTLQPDFPRACEPATHDDLVGSEPDFNLHDLTGSADGFASHATLVQPRPYLIPEVMRFDINQPRAIVLRGTDTSAPAHFVLQPGCSFPRRRGVRK